MLPSEQPTSAFVKTASAADRAIRHRLHEMAVFYVDQLSYEACTAKKFMSHRDSYIAEYELVVDTLIVDFAEAVYRDPETDRVSIPLAWFDMSDEAWQAAAIVEAGKLNAAAQRELVKRQAAEEARQTEIERDQYERLKAKFDPGASR